MSDQSKIESTKKIIKQLKSKDGIYGFCAKICEDDLEMASQFILECSEQCHTSLAISDWGDVLIHDILEYKKRFGSK